MRPRVVAQCAVLTAAVAVPALAGFAGTDLFIPMAGRGVGAYPSNWFTTVYLYNPNDTAVTVDLTFLERNRDNVASAPPRVAETLAAGETRILENIVETEFARSAYGAVRIRCAEKVVATARVFSKESPDAPLTESFGQDFAATPSSFAIGIGESTDVLGGYTTQPYQDSEARFNIGCVETTGLGSATVRWIARDAAGQEQRHYDRTVLRLSQTQGFFHDYFTGVDLTNARISAQVIAGAGRVICYGSLVTNDREFPKPVQDPTTFEMVYPEKLLGSSDLYHDATLTGAGTAAAPLGLADGSVTDDKVASGIAYAKLTGAPASLPPSGLAGNALRGTYPDPGLAENSVGTGQVLDGAVTKAKLAAPGGAFGQLLGTDGADLVWQSSGPTLPPGSYSQTLYNGGAGWLASSALTNDGVNVGIAGDLLLPSTDAGGTAGVIKLGGSPFVHNLGGGTFLGVHAGNFGITGGFITAVGSSALASDTQGSWNTAVGAQGLTQNTTGGGNTALGAGSLQGNTTGDNNTAAGLWSLASNSTAYENTAVGFNSLTSNTTASLNTALGSDALRMQSYDNSGSAWRSENTAVGWHALYSNQPTTAEPTPNGAFNTAVGAESLWFNTTGSSNTAVGTLSLSNNSTGSSNIAIGHLAGFNLTTGDHNIDIGSPGEPNESWTVRIGREEDASQWRTFIVGVHGIPVGGGSAVFVNRYGQLGTLPSSIRFKQEVRDIGEASSPLLRLRPVMFRYTTEPDGPPQYGLIAEEVARVMPELVVNDAAGQPSTVAYQQLPALLLNELQKQQATIGSQQAEIAALRDQLVGLSTLRARVEQLLERIAALEHAGR